MEINKLPNSTDLHQTAMDDLHLLHHHQIHDFNSLSPYFSFQHLPSSSSTHFPSSSSSVISAPYGDPPRPSLEAADHEEPEEELGAMKEMMYKIAAMQPVDIDPSTIRKPKRRNVRISDDPQSTAARLRRERISEKIRILQRLVPGGTKMDTASMLDEAIRYVKFLKKQIRLLQSSSPPQQQTISDGAAAVGWPCSTSSSTSMEALMITPSGW